MNIIEYPWNSWNIIHEINGFNIEFPLDYSVNSLEDHRRSLLLLNFQRRCSGGISHTNVFQELFQFDSQSSISKFAFKIWFPTLIALSKWCSNSSEQLLRKSLPKVFRSLGLHYSESSKEIESLNSKVWIRKFGFESFESKLSIEWLESIRRSIRLETITWLDRGFSVRHFPTTGFGIQTLSTMDSNVFEFQRLENIHLEHSKEHFWQAFTCRWDKIRMQMNRSEYSWYWL